MQITRTHIITALVILAIVLIAYNVKFNENNDLSYLIPQPRSRKSKDNKVLLIIGPGRSGTSLLGEMFNSRKDFIYFFEPLKAIRSYHEILETTSLQQSQFVLQETSEYLKDIVTCNYRSRNDKYIRLLHNSGMFWSRMDFLKGPPFCNYPEVDQKECKAVNITSVMMNKMCDGLNKSVTIVIKDLYKNFAYNDPSLLQFLPLEQPKIFYVLHALRDPRAILNSHRKLHWITDTVNKKNHVEKQSDTAVPIFCLHMMKLLKDFPSAPGPNTVRYSIFRYDDIAYMNLGRMASSLADFLRLDLHDEFQKYLEEKTQAEREITKTGTLSLAARDMSEAIMNWRREIPIDLLDQIQGTESCQQLITMLGFDFAVNKEELLDENKVLVKDPVVLEVIGH